MNNFDPKTMHTPNRDLVNEAKLTPMIVTVAELLADRRMEIPPYQRPYKWTTVNVGQLFDDIATFKEKSSYRLGTIVFHEDEDGTRNIVDGQQRTITLLLAVRALAAEMRSGVAWLGRKDLLEKLAGLSVDALNPEFTSSQSIRNIHANYREIVRIIRRADFTEEMVDFLLNRCDVVTFTLGNISEAFQFFDSQNARGKDLEPHDLLKAYHLREFDTTDERMKAATVAHWERCESDDLVRLFGNYLYRIRNWSRGAPARYFGKKDVGLFKGIHIDRVSRYPYVDPLRIAHDFVDHHAGQYERKIDGRVFPYPFQLDQTILNGRRFFEFIEHYRSTVARIAKASEEIGVTAAGAGLEPQAREIMRVINSYPGMHRDGDLYVRGIFDCLLIYYLDRFGSVELSRVIEKIFIWAYSIRLRMQVVQFATVDNHVLATGMFQKIKEATHPREFLQVPLPLITEKDARKKIEPIQKLFKDMGYHE